MPTKARGFLRAMPGNPEAPAAHLIGAESWTAF